MGLRYAGDPAVSRPDATLTGWSLLRPENEAQVEAFLAAHGGFRVLPIATVWAESVGGACPTDEALLMLKPGRHGVDGFFVAVLAREVES